MGCLLTCAQEWRFRPYRVSRFTRRLPDTAFAGTGDVDKQWCEQFPLCCLTIDIQTPPCSSASLHEKAGCRTSRGGRARMKSGAVQTSTPTEKQSLRRGRSSLEHQDTVDIAGQSPTTFAFNTSIPNWCLLVRARHTCPGSCACAVASREAVHKNALYIVY